MTLVQRTLRAAAVMALVAALVLPTACRPPEGAPQPLRLPLPGNAARQLQRWQLGGPAERLERGLGLLLLLDEARWRGDRRARQLLLEATGLSDGARGGAALAARVARHIAGELRGLRRLPGATAAEVERAEQALVSLDWDVLTGSAASTRLESLAPSLAALRREARRRDRSGLFAALRLLGFCLDAFDEAGAAAAALREPLAARCLMALDDGDVSRHLDADPRRRLPSPGGRGYGHSLAALLDGHARPAELHGTAPLVAAARQKLEAVVTWLTPLLPPSWALGELGLVELPFAEPFENAPWIRLPAPAALRTPDEARALATRDPRRALLVVARAASPVGQVLQLAGPLATAGLSRLDLAVLWRPAVGPPRLGRLPLLLGRPPAPGERRVGVALEPGLTVECSPRELQLRLGGLAEARLAFDASPATLIAVRQLAQRLRGRAAGLPVQVRPSPELTVGALVKLLAALRTDEQGAPLLGPMVLPISAGQ